IKAALNLVLNIGCKDKLIGIINGFIDQKKNNNSENNENENLHILDSLVHKRREHPPSTSIKSSTENQLQNISIRNSAINLIDPNLYIHNNSKNTAVKTLLNTLT
ncbi:11982_t:CDS:1, partial [Dentiscutata erythropus]